MSNNKSESYRAAARGAEARTREVHAGKGAMKTMSPPIQEQPEVSARKAKLKAAAEHFTRK